MTALERVAWLEAGVSLAALATAAALYPWLGNGAVGGFALLGFLGFSVFCVRRRGAGVVVDERDRAIEQRSLRIGVGAAWMVLFTTLIAATLWSTWSGRTAVPTRFLNWLIWCDFAVCYLVKGLLSVAAYRGQSHAAQG